MITREKVDQLEKLMGQLEAMHLEISALAKKSHSDAINDFKLRIVNAALQQCNALLGKEYYPVSDFTQLETDSVPSNSDVTFVLSQYLQAVEKFRGDNISKDAIGPEWHYDLKKGEAYMRSVPPAKFKG